MAGALASGDLGRVIRAYRCHPFHGERLPQTVVAGWLHMSQAAVCRIETGRRRVTIDEIANVAAVLGMPVALPWTTHPEVGEDVDRREFLTGATGFMAQAALAGIPTPKRRLGQADLEQLRQSIVRLYKLDDQHGGAGSVYALTTKTFHRLRGLVERASYDAASGRALREFAGQTAVHAGWLAFDADCHDDARRWWLEAIHWSRLADAESVGVLAMASMARQAFDQQRPREAVDLATTAQRTAGRAATPRLMSILLAREALGHAGRGDTASAHAALRRGRALADRPRREDDPTWLNFYGPADFASHEYRVALTLGDFTAAERAARTAHTLDDPVAYPRNYALGLIELADALVRQRQIDESAAVASQAADAAADLDSRRVTRGLGAVARRLAPFKDDPGVGAHLDAVQAALA
jgi:hypothetical protein